MQIIQLEVEDKEKSGSKEKRKYEDYKSFITMFTSVFHFTTYQATGTFSHISSPFGGFYSLFCSFSSLTQKQLSILICKSFFLGYGE